MYLLEAWGQTALECGRRDDAEEDFVEALAHDGYRGFAAPGFKIIYERLRRPDEVTRYADFAKTPAR